MATDATAPDYKGACEALITTWALTHPQETVAERLTCGEANAIAAFFKMVGLPGEAESWIEGHAYSDTKDDQHHNLHYPNKAAAFVREEL